MLKKVQNQYLVSVESRLLYLEKLEYLKRVFSNSVNNISTNIDDIENKYFHELGQDLTELNPDDFEYHRSEVANLVHAAKHFPQIVYKSTIVSAYSIFESTLSEIRVDTENQIKSSIKLKQLRPIGNEIENILNYFKLVHQLKFENLKNELTQLKPLIQIRNIIVHQNGLISQLDDLKKNEIKKFITSESNLSLDKYENIEFENKFVIKYIEFLEKIGHQIFQQFNIIPPHYP